MILLIKHKQPNLFDLCLEKELVDGGFEYKVSTDNSFCLELPIMVVHGVPLDFERAMKYIKESSQNE